MLKKKYRLPIQEVFQKRGVSIKTPYFLLKIFENNLPFNRFGVIISKKASPIAARRNNLKRIFFNQAQGFISLGKIKKDFLFILSPKISLFKRDEAAKLFQETFKKFISNV